MNASPVNVIVVGAGAAGLLAAGRAAACGARVRLLEKMGQPGRKINISGKGRCNLTNTSELPDFLNHFGRNGRFLRQAFNSFFRDDLIQLLEKNGVAVAFERGGRVFPQSGKAPDVTKALVRWVRKKGVLLHCNTGIQGFKTVNGRMTAVVTQKGKVLDCDRVILATGGCTYPRTGSTGDSYPLCTELGHTLIPIRPALVPLDLPPYLSAPLDGLHLKNIHAALFHRGKKKADDFGECTFTHTGISGPVVLTLSDPAVELLHQGEQDLELVLDLKPALDYAKLDNRLQRDLKNRHTEPIHSILRGLLPRELVGMCLQHLQINPNLPGHQVGGTQRKALRNWLKELRLPITGHRPMDEALVTAGGISLKEVDPRTMQSRLIDGLFLTGELLDLHADTGGFNLQAAFSTGWLAGSSASTLPFNAS